QSALNERESLRAAAGFGELHGMVEAGIGGGGGAMGLRAEAERARKSGAAEEQEKPRRARADPRADHGSTVQAHVYNAGMRIANGAVNENAAAHEERPEKTRPDGGEPSGEGG
ncbi:MAG: hypothetical protein WCA44_12450, partial [Acidobacteriaceae bacterium]